MPAEDVERAVIQPMRSTLPAPHHVRGNPEATETLLNVYRQALARFDRTVLEQAWLKVAAEQDYWMWPMPLVIVKAAEEIHKAKHPPKSDDWRERAETLADEAVHKFLKTSRHAASAEAGGYQRELREYVRCVAMVQAQHLIGRKDVAYEGATLFQCGAGQGEREEFFEAWRRQAETGAIKIVVPRELAAKWRQEAKGEEKGGERRPDRTGLGDVS